MKFLNLQKRPVTINTTKYLMDWNCKEKSNPQFQVKKFLKKYWLNYVVYRELTVPGTRLKIDIYNASKKIAIEVDGNQHLDYNSFFHKNRLGYLKSFMNDHRKEQWCEINNIKLIRIYIDEVNKLSPEFFKERFGIVLV